MALVNPPLFMQTGKYLAAHDRSLIGALLFPSGESQLPRVGVRPSGLVSSSEGSLRVSPAAENGRVTVAAGSAFVPTAEPTGPLNGVYLVVNDADFTVNCEVSGVASGGKVKLYVQARDAAFMVGAPTTTAESKFVVLAATTAPPAGSLLLATITWNGSGSAVSIDADERQYTSGLGGVVRVQTTAPLTGQGSLAKAPYGSLAYVHADGLVYTRSTRGWEAAGAVRSGATTARPVVTSAYNGMVYYDTSNGLLQMFSEDSWLTVGSRPPIVGRTVNDLTTKTDVRVVQRVFSGHTFLKIPVSPSGFRDFSQVTAVTGVAGAVAKPTDEALSVRVRVFSKGTVVRAVLSASGWVPLGSSLTGTVVYADYNANLAVDVKKYGTAGSANTSVVNPDTGQPYEANTYTSGLTFYNKLDVLKSRTVHYQLDPGDYLFCVKVSHDGNDPMDNGAFGYFQLHQAVLEVAA